MRYRMIAVDLDDTLLGRDKQMSRANRDAVARAHDAGVLVVPCTGRTWHKAKSLALDVLPMLDVGVFFDGSMVCHCATGRIHHCTTMADDAAAVLLDWFGGRDYTLVYCCRDNASHYGYVVTGDALAKRIVDAWLSDAPVGVVVHDARAHRCGRGRGDRTSRRRAARSRRSRPRADVACAVVCAGRLVGDADLRSQGG
jgi:hypothetical protein